MRRLDRIEKGFTFNSYWFPFRPLCMCQMYSWMNRNRGFLQVIPGGQSDANIRFQDLRSLLLKLGFTERTRASHHAFRKEGIRELINLQRSGSHAKPY